MNITENLKNFDKFWEFLYDFWKFFTILYEHGVKFKKKIEEGLWNY